jgi:CrcB protein
MDNWYWVVLGGMIGAPLRFWIGRVVTQRWKRAFPLGTFLINVTGSFLIELLYAGTQVAWVKAFVGTGILGAYTTFSTFGVETVTLLEQKKVGMAVGYVVISALVGLGAARLGQAWYTNW